MSVSRVLSCTVIYLDLSSPISSSDVHGVPSDGQPYMTETQSCSEWGLHGILCYHNIGELLPRLSILTASGRHPKVYSRPKPSHKRRFISVALSRRSPSPDVIRHLVLCCSDFPHDEFCFAPRPYNKLESINIIPLFLKKITQFPCFFLKKIVK